MNATASPTANTSRASRTTPWCAAPANSWTTRGCRTRPMPPSCARRTRMPASCRSTPTRRARPRACWRCSPPRTSRRPALAASRGHPPVVGRGGAKMVMPFRPALAGERRCMSAMRWPWWWRRRAARRRTPPSWSQSNTRNCRRWSTCEAAMKRRAAALSGRAGQSLRRLAGPGAQRAERARGRRDHRQGAACRARQRHPPAPGGGLDGNARRHRRLRQGQATATRCTPARRAPTPCAARRPPSWACRTTNCG